MKRTTVEGTGTGQEEFGLSPEVLDLLQSPHTGAPLAYDPGGGPEGALVDTRTGRRYPIRNGIPVFVDDADVTGSNRTYQRLYDVFAPFYDMAQKLYYLTQGSEARARSVYLAPLEIREGHRVLEVSVGTGANLRFLPRGARYFGLDLSWRQLQRCRQNLRRYGIEAHLFQGSAEALPFRDESFDVVFHVGGINFFNDKGRAIREMVRVARPGTRIVIADETEKTARRLERVPFGRRFFKDRPGPIVPPVDLIPPGMEEVRLDEVRGGALYVLQFRKPR